MKIKSISPGSNSQESINALDSRTPEHKESNIILRCLTFIEKHFEEAMCGFCLVLMASCIMTQVLLRYFLSSGAPWAEELAVYSMIFAVYLGASMAVKERAHIRILLLVNRFPKKIQLTSIVMADLLWLAFLILMIVQTSIYMQLLFSTTYISPGLGVDQKWFQIVVPVSLVLMVLRMAQVYYRWWRNNEQELPL
ncbi:TRAP transporter small permease [Zobellella maritima]|uniref:TRAP transporter small permease n=1 Tax=Zobellella maritima TaxID=2059725 RepID=UPI000E2FFD1C|nr:TRAP transporter small permease [Zobellella maritima]